MPVTIPANETLEIKLIDRINLKTGGENRFRLFVQAQGPLQVVPIHYQVDLPPRTDGPPASDDPQGATADVLPQSSATENADSKQEGKPAGERSSASDQ